MEKEIKITKEEIKKELAKAIHPEINYNLVELGMIKDIKIKNNIVSITLVLPFLEIPIKENLIDLTKESIRNLNIKIEIKTAKMNEKEKERFMKMANEGWKF